MGVAASTSTPAVAGVSSGLTATSCQGVSGSLHTMSRMTRVEELRSRLLGFQPTDRLWGWLGPLFFAFVGGLMRFWSLGRPHQLVFDETYYVKQGVSMLDY